MSKINDGGPAFPNPIQQFGNGGELHYPDRGLSLRDWFAGQAAAEMCGAITGNKDEPHYATVAIRAYAMADAMLSARKARGGE